MVVNNAIGLESGFFLFLFFSQALSQFTCSFLLASSSLYLGLILLLERLEEGISHLLI